MQVEIIQTIERVFEVELDWDELYRLDNGAHFYLSYRFLSAVAIRTAGKFRILVAWSDDGRCVGILPLLVTTRWHKSEACLYNALDMLGHVFDADYTGILCDPAMEASVCQAFAREVSQMPFARLILNYFNGPPSRLQAFVDALPGDVFEVTENQHFINDAQTNNLVCPFIELPDDFSAYLAGLGTSSRQKIRRLLRALDSDPDLKITSSRPETYTEDVTVLARLWYLQYAERKGQKRAARLADLFKEAVMLGLAAGMVHLSILWRDGKPVAAQANYIDWVKAEALFHVGARDQRSQDLSAGTLLQAHSIRWAIANGLKRYDFTVGDEAYKYKLGATDRTLRSVEIHTRTGLNHTGRLDPACRGDVVKHLRDMIARGRDGDARRAASQALAVWPDMAPDGDAGSLLADVAARHTKGDGQAKT